MAVLSQEIASPPSCQPTQSRGFAHDQREIAALQPGQFLGEHRHTFAAKPPGRRPLKLVRHTKGTTFYHMGPVPPIPTPVHQLRIEKRDGGQGIRFWIDDLAGLLALVEIGAVELHPWGATVDDIEHPDLLVFDLDRGDGIPWEFMTETAFRYAQAARCR